MSAVLDSTVDGSIALVTDVSVTANRRMLLSGVSVSYTVTVSSGRTPDYYVTSLQSSLGSNTFVATLSSNSGVPIEGISGLVILNKSPTPSPTYLPNSVASSHGMFLMILDNHSYKSGELLHIHITLPQYFYLQVVSVSTPQLSWQ